jgi:hypothetical protein
MAKEVAVRVETSHVEWGPVFAGALAAAALSFVLLSAAASLGLSLISAYPGHAYAKTGGTVAALWSLIVTIGSFMLGGYIAGRLRSSWREGGPDEVAFRDGMHGFLVWSIGIVAGSFLVLLATMTTAQVGANAASTAAAQSDTVLAPATDTLLRSSPTAPATAAALLDRDEVVHVLAISVANGQMSANDRGYLAQAVAQRAGIPAADAEKRVDTAFTDAQRAVESARKAAALTGLLTASALLIGLAAAWYGAQRGGHNRDHNIWGRSPMMVRERRVQAPLD